MYLRLCRVIMFRYCSPYRQYHPRRWCHLCSGRKVVVLTLVAVLLCSAYSCLHASLTLSAALEPAPGSSTKSSTKTFRTISPLIGRLRVRLPGDTFNGTVRMRHRQQVLRQYCSGSHWQEFSDSMASSSHYRTNSLVSKHRHLFYCPVGKVASTFLTRFLVAAEETDPVVSPFFISPDKALRVRTKSSGNNILFTPLSSLVPTGWREKEYLESVMRVLFVRCPFHRLWSAYVDKLLFPNPYYWQTWGVPALNRSIISAERDRDAQAAPTAVKCGQNVTFPQFIDFVLDELHAADTHVRPVSKECSPCYVNFDFIGHVETLTGDVMHLATLLQLSNSTLGQVNWDEDHARDSILDGVTNVYRKWPSQIQQCLDMTEAGRRLWRVLQIRGIISEKEKYPFRTGKHGALSSDPEAVEAALLRARAQSARNKELERQKAVAFLEAYQTVTAEAKNRIRKLYEADFKMFGFDELQGL